MTTENYSRFIKVILKEATERERRYDIKTDDTQKDKAKEVKNTYIEKLNCFICYIMYALYSSKLDDIEKAQYALKKFEENPFFLLDGDFYVKELVKYKDKDINTFYCVVFIHNVYWLNFDSKLAAVMSEIQKNFENSEGTDETLSSEIKKICHTLVNNLFEFAVLRSNEFKAALLEAYDKNIPVSKARKYIEKFLEQNESFNYWHQVMGGHNDRVLKVYMNALETINVDMLQYPYEEGKLLKENVRYMGLSDLTLPGFVLFFIMGERNEDFRKYIKGDGENIDINFLRKDANILKFSNISWLYNIFYLKHFIYFNAKLILVEKKKLTRAAAKHFEKLVVELKKGIDELKKSADKLKEGADELKKSADKLKEGADELKKSVNELEESADKLEKRTTEKEMLKSIKKYPSIEKIYEVNKKVLEWIEREEWKQYFLEDLEAYKNCILQKNIEVVFPELKSEKNINREKILGIKVEKCAPTLWNVYNKLEQFKDKMPLIDFDVKKRIAIEYLNSIDGSENKEKREKIKQLLDEIILISRA